MSPIKLLRSLFYGFLLFTARSFAEPPRRVDEVRMVGPALPAVPTLIQSVIEYQSQNTINYLVGAIQETQKNYYLDEQTFIELEKMYEYILYPYTDLSYALKTRIETTYLLHIKSYLTLKKEYKALPSLKKSIIKRYETAINYRGKFPPLEKDPIEENFKDARQTIVPQSSESFLSFMASNQKNQINTTAFHQLISDAQHSPLAKNCEDLLTALEIINNSQRINELPALTLFDMRHAKALIKQETDFLDIQDVIKFTRSITQEEFNFILMIYPLEADALIEMLALSTIEDIGLEIVNYIANDRINNFIAEHLAQDEPLENIFQIIDSALSSPLAKAEMLSDLYTSTAAAFMELSEHNLAFTDKKFSRPITSLIKKHIEQASTDPLRISIYNQQKDLMMQRLSPEYLDSSKDALFLVELNKKLPAKDSYEKQKILIPLFHQFYNFNYYPNDHMLRKLNDLALAGTESFTEILNETFMLHFITYSKLSNRDDLDLKLPKLKKSVEQYLNDEMANFSKEKAYLAFLYNDLLEKFYSAVKRRPIKETVYPELPNAVNATAIKRQIIDLKKSFFQDDYMPLIHMIKYNHIPSTPEMILWTQCADFIIRNETNYFDNSEKYYQIITQRTLTTALENSETTSQEFFQIFRETPPDFIKESYVHYLGRNLAIDFINKVNINNPELFFNTLNRMNLEGKPIDIKQMHAAAALAMIELNETETFTAQNFTAQVFHWIAQSRIPENTFRYEIYEKAKQVIIENYRPLLSFYPRMVVYFTLPCLIMLFSIKYLHPNFFRPQVSPPPVSDAPDTKKLIIDHYKNTAQPIDEFPKKWGAFAITLKSVLLVIDQNPDLIVEKHKAYARTLYASWQLQSDGEKFIIFINRNIDWLITHKKYDLFKLLGQLSLDYQNLNWEELLVTVDNKYLEKNRINQINLLKSKLLEVIKNKKYVRLVNDFYDPDNKSSWINGTEHANARHFINQNKTHLDADTVRALDTMFPVIIRDFTFAYTDSYENDDEDKIFPNFLFDTTIQQSNEQMKIPALETQSTQNNVSSDTQVALNKITVTINEKYVGEALGLEPYIYERFSDIENQYIHPINLAYKFLIIRFFSITPLAKLKPDARKIFINIRDGLCHDWNKMTQINPIDLNVYLSDILNSISETKNNITSLEELFKKLNLYDSNFLNLNRRWENIHIPEETAKQKLSRLFEELSAIEKMPVNMRNIAVRANDDILAQIGETLRYAHIDIPADVKHYFITLRNDAYHKYDFKQDTQVVLYLEKLKTHLTSDAGHSLYLNKL